jgi:DNA-binding SARP family transcriptional activator
MGDQRVQVAVLGPVQVAGLAHPFRRSAARELVVYLALHPEGAGTSTWTEALWPTHLVSQATIHSTVSDARRALGRTASGEERLPRAGRRLRLGDAVTTDVERFADLASRSGVRSWKEALTLVRGGLFDGMQLSDWAVFDGTQAQLEAMVVTTALKASEIRIGQGRGAEAEWMVRRGLRVSPYDERLYRALLRAVDAQGNRTGLRSTMAELLWLAGDRDAQYGPDQVERQSRSFHPRTVALYRQLARGPVPATRR